MKKHSLSIVLFALLSFLAVSCSEDSDDPTPDSIENQLIGIWKAEAGSYWFQYTFNADLTGNRTDSDGEDDDFKYKYTIDMLSFTEGPFDNVFEYRVSGDTLFLGGGPLLKQ